MKIISYNLNGLRAASKLNLLNWLKKYNIEYDEIFFTNNFSDDEKANVCLKNNVKIMIDDSKKNSYAVAKAGITDLLMDT